MRALLSAVAAAFALSGCAGYMAAFKPVEGPDPQVGMTVSDVDHTWVGKISNAKYHKTQTGDKILVQVVLPCGKCYSYSANGMDTWYLYFEGYKSQGADSVHLVSIQN